MIKKVSKHSYCFVETDDKEMFEYRRLGPDNWEVKMGWSWETCNCEELEQEFQEYLKQLENNFD